MPYRFLIALAATLPLSVALCAAFAMVSAGGWRHAAIGAMALTVPLWIGATFWLMAISPRRRFVGWLAGGNAAAFALFFAAQLTVTGSGS